MIVVAALAKKIAQLSSSGSKHVGLSVRADVDFAF